MLEPHLQLTEQLAFPRSKTKRTSCTNCAKGRMATSESVQRGVSVKLVTRKLNECYKLMQQERVGNKHVHEVC